MEDSVKYKVTNRATGSSFAVEPGETVLAAARRAGVHLSYSCLKGNCQSCLATVLEGDWHYPFHPPAGLDDRQVRAGGALLCQAVPRSDLVLVAREASDLAAISTRRIRLRVRAREHLADELLRLFLEPVDGGPLAYLAGQYLDFILADGKRRAFSIACAPRSDGLLELHVRHVPGGGFTDFLFHGAPVGATLEAEAPLGTFFLRAQSPRPVICVAGGTGFAPIKAIVEQFVANRDERPLILFRGARRRDELYLDALPCAWAQEHPRIEYRPVLSAEPPGSTWAGARGLVHRAVLAAHPDLGDFDVYMSGPPALIDAGRDEFLAAGLPRGHLYYDSFEFAPDVQVHMAASSP